MCWVRSVLSNAVNLVTWTYKLKFIRCAFSALVHALTSAQSMYSVHGVIGQQYVVSLLGKCCISNAAKCS